MNRLGVLLAFGLTACATAPERSVDRPVTASNLPAVETSSIPSNTLSAQQLRPGECGLFGWSTDNPPEFVFFATQTRALYLDGEVPRRLTPRDGFPALDYGDVTLELGEGEDLIEGVRYTGARLKQALPDGFERVQPVVILESCG